MRIDDLAGLRGFFFFFFMTPLVSLMYPISCTDMDTKHVGSDFHS